MATRISSGLEVTWTTTPTKWSNNFFWNLFGYEWELTKSPAGAHQWKPKHGMGEGSVPDAHDPSKRHAPTMLTTDLALRFDPAYEKISRRFHENPDEFATAFAKAWFKLTHRDMGPLSRYAGKLVPAEPQLWQDPVPPVTHELIGAEDIAALKAKILASGLSISQLVSTAWASASTFRGTDKRGGANGARIRLAPQKDWDVNNPPELAKVLQILEGIQKGFNDAQAGGKKRVSLADLIVLGGCAAVEQAAKAAGFDVQVPFTPGRTDASQEQTDVESFAVLEPTADGFRNYLGQGQTVPAEVLLIDRAQLLTLSAPEMTVLVGGMRALNANARPSELGVFTKRPGTLTNDFFVNLLDMDTEWKPTSDAADAFEGRGRGTGELKWTASRVDLALRLELRAPRPRGGLRVRRREGEVRARLRGRVEQGHESRSIRPRLIPTFRSAVAGRPELTVIAAAPAAARSPTTRPATRPSRCSPAPPRRSRNPGRSAGRRSCPARRRCGRSSSRRLPCFRRIRRRTSRPAPYRLFPVVSSAVCFASSSTWPVSAVREAQQVSHRRVAPSSRRAAVGQRVGVRHPHALLLHVTLRPAGYRHILRLGAAAGHAGWPEDVIADVVVVALSRHAFHDHAEQQEPVVAVLPLRPGLELEAARAVELHVVVERLQFQAARV